MGLTEQQLTATISPPHIQCGHCGFVSPIAGRWTVEGHSLVFRASDDPQPRRGPDLGGCCESSPAISFKHIEVIDTDGRWDGRNLLPEEVEVLKAAATRDRLD